VHARWFGRLLVVMLVVGLTVWNISGWQIEDDEGSGLYAIWRLSEGDRPYENVLSSMAPLYLLVGKALVGMWGRDLVLLRLAGACGIISCMTVLALVIKRIWGASIAITFWSMTLLTPEVYHIARVFRSDTLMLAIIALALAALLVNAVSRKRRCLVLSGFFFGVAALAKVVAFMPFLGALAWIGLRGCRRLTLREVVLDLVALTGAAGIVVGLGYGLLELTAPGALASIIASPGAYSSGLASRLMNGLLGWTALIIQNWLLFLALPMPFLLSRSSEEDVSQLWTCQVLGSAPFLLLSSPAYPRYLVYIVPSMIMVFLIGMKRFGLRFPDISKPSILLLAFVFPVVAAWPGRAYLLRQETATRELAAWVREHTDPSDVVVADYAELSFHSGRQSIPCQSVISHNWSLTGLVTGKRIVQSMQEMEAKVFLLHVEGGSVSPQHLYYLQDYELLIGYLEREFTLVRTWDRAGQLIEIWYRF